MIVTTEHNVYFISSKLSIRDQLKRLFQINEEESTTYGVPIFTDEEADRAYEEYVNALGLTKAQG